MHESRILTVHVWILPAPARHGTAAASNASYTLWQGSRGRRQRRRGWRRSTPQGSATWAGRPRSRPRGLRVYVLDGCRIACTCSAEEIERVAMCRRTWTSSTMDAIRSCWATSLGAATLKRTKTMLTWYVCAPRMRAKKEMFVLVLCACHTHMLESRRPPQRACMGAYLRALAQTSRRMLG